MQGLAHWRTPDRVPELFKQGVDQKLPAIPCATPNSHRPVQKLPALIGNPRSSQQLMGQLPICCCSKAKKFNDFSRAGVGVCVSGRGEAWIPNRGTPAFVLSNIHEVGGSVPRHDRANDRFPYRRPSPHRYRCPQMLSVSDMPARLGDSTAETTIRPLRLRSYPTNK